MNNTKTEVDKSAEIEKASAAIKEIVQRLESLNIKPTSERLNLIASAYRRIAEINKATNAQQYIDNLAESAFYYHKGYIAYLNVFNKPYYYSLHNWLIISIIIGELLDTAEQNKYEDTFKIIPPESFDKMLQDADDYAVQLDERNPDFWNKTSASSKFLLKLILAKSTDEVNKCKDAIVENHIRAWKIEGSANKQNAIGEHADFVISMFKTYKEKLKNLSLITTKIKVLENLKQELG